MRFVFFSIAALLASHAGGQVVINEVCPNPPGGGNEPRYEYVELYGQPGMDLSGYMLAAVFGGGDPDADGVPGPLPANWLPGDEVPIIDEAWSLDGLSLGTNGLLVLYNNNLGNSSILSQLPAATARAPFAAVHIAIAGNAAGDVRNNGSQNYILLRRRPLQMLVNRASVYQPGYAWVKGVDPDVDFNGRIDLNGVGLLSNNTPPSPESPVNSEELGAPPIGAPQSLEPYQMVDEVGCSDGGGREYLRSGNQRISDTPGGNPDGMSRVAYYGTNPMLGWRLDPATGMAVPTTSADEEFFYGEMSSVTPTLSYDPLLSGGPTDPAGQRFNAQHVPDPLGTYLFNDISRAGYRLTPGSMNDVDGRPVGGANIVEFRFVAGDFDFNGVVNASDEALIVSRLGATLDDTAPVIDTRGTASPADDVTISNAWKWQGREFQALLMMLNMDRTDGTAGDNSPAVTMADITAFRVLLPCPADFNHIGGVTVQDIFDFLYAYFLSLPAADLNHNGSVTIQDVFDFLVAYFAGC